MCVENGQNLLHLSTEASWLGQRQLRNQDSALNNHFLYQCHMGFIPIGVNMITDSTNSFAPFLPKKHTGPIFHNTRLPNPLTLDWHFSDTQIRSKLTLLKTCLCLSNTFSPPDQCSRRVVGEVTPPT